MKRYSRRNFNKSEAFYLTQLQSSDNGKNISNTVFNFQGTSQSKMKNGVETTCKVIYDTQKQQSMI